MIYQAYKDTDKPADYEADSYDSLINAVVDHCLHTREREPFFTMIDAVGDDNSIHLNVRDFNNRVHYEIECGWY